MRHIMVMNAKGGCGKSTLATNLASYYADAGYGVALADYDPQRSSLDWLERRPDDRAEIRKLLSSVDLFPDRSHLVGVYSLGKAQRVIALIREAGYDRPLYIHGALEELCALYERNGVARGEQGGAAQANRCSHIDYGRTVGCLPQFDLRQTL